MAINNQIVGGNFTDLQGAPLADGYLTFELSQDSQSTSGQVCAGAKVLVSLDSTGNVPASPPSYIFANDALVPSGSTYLIKCYSAAGQLVWQGRFQILSTPIPFDLGALGNSGGGGGGLF